MTRVRARGEDIRRFILERVEKHPTDIAKITSEKFGISRQAANKHLNRLIEEKALVEAGKTKAKTYSVCPTFEWEKLYELGGSPSIAEDVVWRNDVVPVLGVLPENVSNIWHYAFTEMFNNAIDHSEGTRIMVEITKTALRTEMVIWDNGIGIFKKIQNALGLLDPRHAVLELAKGKLTTDPTRHSGEGIFFTSRMFDSFLIISEGIVFSHDFGDMEDWIHETEAKPAGTHVVMRLNNHTARTTKKVFDQFTSADDFRFNRTVVPVRLAQYGNEQLISRSQAKRVIARIELFKVVLFDFEGVASIGQAFADEVFRVFANQHPEIELLMLNASSEVKRMIERVRTGTPIEDVSSKQEQLPGIEPEPK